MKLSTKLLVTLGLLSGLVFLVMNMQAAPLAATNQKAVFGETKPVGPYSPGVDVGNLVFLAGQIGIDPATGKMVEGGVEAETKQVMKNAEAVLKAAGLGWENVVKTTVFLAAIEDFTAMNGVYGGYFPDGTVKPARSTVAVSGLAAGASVEIDFIAAR